MSVWLGGWQMVHVGPRLRLRLRLSLSLFWTILLWYTVLLYLEYYSTDTRTLDAPQCIFAGFYILMNEAVSDETFTVFIVVVV